MDLLSYLRVIRRRWRLVVGCVLVGGVLGGAWGVLGSSSSSSSSSSKAPVGNDYRATHTLITTPPTGESLTVPPLFTSLDQMALLVTTSDVKNQVAAKLGIDALALSERVSTFTDPSTATLQISAVDEDSAQATRIADAFAAQLVDYIKQRDQANFDKARDDSVRRLNESQQRLKEVGGPVAPDVASDPVKTAERDSVASQYRLAYERVQLLATQGGPAPPPLGTLDAAQSVPISADEYDAQIANGRLGQNHGTVTATVPADGTAPAAAGSVALPGPVGRGVLGAIFGLLVGVGIAVATDRFDQRLRTRDDTEVAFGLPVLAEIPSLSRAQQNHMEILARDAPFSRTAEAYRAVRSSVLFQVGQPIGGTDAASGNGNGQQAPRPGLVVMVASASAGEGKSTTAANLAVVFAEAGSSVLLVNGDFRRPKVHRFFGLDDEPRRLLKTSTRGLLLVSNVLADPGANPAQVAEAQRQIIAQARQRVDVVILDTAPLLSTNDAAELVGAVDQVVLVARAESTTHDEAQRAAALLQRVNAPVIGVVFVGVNPASSDYYYYYSRHAANAIKQSQRGAVRRAAAAGDSVFVASPDAPVGTGAGPTLSN